MAARSPSAKDKQCVDRLGQDACSILPGTRRSRRKSSARESASMNLPPSSFIAERIPAKETVSFSSGVSVTPGCDGKPGSFEPGKLADLIKPFTGLFSCQEEDRFGARAVHLRVGKAGLPWRC
jgi:hypothetical protein